MKVYVTCAHTLSGGAYEPIANLATELIKGMGHEVHETQPLTDPNQVFELDMDALKNTDILIAEVSEPSHGVGVEIAASWFLKFPCICLHKKGTTVLRFVRGFPNAKFLEYENEEDIRTKLPELVKE